MSLLCRSTALLFGFAPLIAAQTAGVRGDWRTANGAVVRIADCSTDPSTVCATIQQLEPNPPARVDSRNPDAAQRGRPLCGLQIGYGFHLGDPNHADGGHLYDPKSGNLYRGSMVSSGDRLSLRGYVGLKAFGRSEQWTRTSPVKTCS